MTNTTDLHVTTEQLVAKASELQASPTDVIASIIGYDHPGLEYLAAAYFAYASEGHSDEHVAQFVNAMIEEVQP